MLSSLTEQVSAQIATVLDTFLVRSEAQAVFLCDERGVLLGFESHTGGYQGDTITALAAGAFSATRELARLVGEPEFRSVLHQGEMKSIFIHATDMGMYLVVVFDKQTNPGLVKFYLDDTVYGIETVLHADAGGADAQDSVKGLEINLRPNADLFRPSARACS